MSGRRLPWQFGAVLCWTMIVCLLVLTACTPEQAPASAARTAAALRTPAAASTAASSGAGVPPTLAPAGVATTQQPGAVGAATAAVTTPERGGDATPAPGVSLVASPNPVPIGAGGLGTTIISWTTGGLGDGEVYVSPGGGPEKLFASGPEGSAEVAWIQPTSSYEFRLYAGKEHSQLLATLTIGQPTSGLKPAAGGIGSAPALSAMPNPAPADDQEMGTTTVTWSSDGPDGGEVYASEDGGPEVLFASGTPSSAQAPWICRGHIYEFHLYAGPGRNNLEGSVTVTRAPDPPDQPPPARVQCRPPPGQ